MTRVHLTLIRHAETDWNHAQRLQGHRDISLNAQGHLQVEALVGRYLSARAERVPDGTLVAPPVVVSSDLLRCRQTAGPVATALGVPVSCDAALRERHFGAFEGRSLAELAQQAPEEVARWTARDPDFAPAGGETLRDLAQRVATCLEGWLARHPDGELVVVTHGGVLDIVHRLARGLSLQAPSLWRAANAGLYGVLWEAGRFVALEGAAGFEGG